MASAYAPPYERCTDCKERAGVTVQVKGSTKESKTCILRFVCENLTSSVLFSINNNEIFLSIKGVSL